MRRELRQALIIVGALVLAVSFLSFLVHPPVVTADGAARVDLRVIIGIIGVASVGVATVVQGVTSLEATLTGWRKQGDVAGRAAVTGTPEAPAVTKGNWLEQVRSKRWRAYLIGSADTLRVVIGVYAFFALVALNAVLMLGFDRLSAVSARTLVVLLALTALVMFATARAWRRTIYGWALAANIAAVVAFVAPNGAWDQSKLTPDVSRPLTAASPTGFAARLHRCPGRGALCARPRTRYGRCSNLRDLRNTTWSIPGN
jgi:hypothetical protein